MPPCIAPRPKARTAGWKPRSRPRNADTCNEVCSTVQNVDERHPAPVRRPLSSARMPTGDQGLTTPEDPASRKASAQGMHPYDGRDPGLLLGAMQRTAVTAMGKVLDAILRQADDYLFDHSQGGDGAELTALRDLR